MLLDVNEGFVRVLAELRRLTNAEVGTLTTPSAPALGVWLSSDAVV